MIKCEKQKSGSYVVSTNGTIRDLISEIAAVISSLVEDTVEETDEDFGKKVYMLLTMQSAGFIKQKTGINVLDISGNDEDELEDDDDGIMNDAISQAILDALRDMDDDDGTKDDLPLF